MEGTWKRRSTAGGIGLALGLVLVAIIAAAPPKETTSRVERRTAEPSAYNDMGRAARGSREFPTPGTHAPTCGEGVSCRFPPSTDSGGLYVEGLGTVSHANLDNNFARLTDPSWIRHVRRVAAGLRQGS